MIVLFQTKILLFRLASKSWSSNDVPVFQALRLQHVIPCRTFWESGEVGAVLQLIHAKWAVRHLVLSICLDCWIILLLFSPSKLRLLVLAWQTFLYFIQTFSLYMGGHEIGKLLPRKPGSGFSWVVVVDLSHAPPLGSLWSLAASSLIIVLCPHSCCVRSSPECLDSCDWIGFEALVSLWNGSIKTLGWLFVVINIPYWIL